MFEVFGIYEGKILIKESYDTYNEARIKAFQIYQTAPDMTKITITTTHADGTLWELARLYA